MTEIVLEPGGPPSRSGQPVLEIENLHVSFVTEEGSVQAVRGVDMSVDEHEVLGVVGESGSGKSVTMLAVMGLLPPTATITGSARFRGQELLGPAGRGARGLRGGRLAMIFQDPLSALNPVHRVGDQIAEAVEAHNPTWNHKQTHAKAVEMLELVGIPQPATRARQYPHEFSGGMRQRAMIAMAIANGPELLIADEPTTALDVTIQAQILDVLQQVQEATRAAIVFITHDLGVIARLADRVQVMYAGRAVEVTSTATIFTASRHPYTRGLLASLPRLDDAQHETLQPIPGSPPSMLNPPPGCAFHPRCAMAQPECAVSVPALRLVGSAGQVSACHLAEEIDPVDSPGALPDNAVAAAPDKAARAEVAEAAVADQGRRKLSLGAVAAFVLGGLTPIVTLAAKDAEVSLRGAIVMMLGIPAVVLARQATRAIRAGEGRLRGASITKIGNAFAWTSLVVWGFYCLLWVLASVLPPQTT